MTHTAHQTVIDQWDPSGDADLPDDTALHLDSCEECRAHFDARFASVDFGAEAPVPDDLAERMLPDPQADDVVPLPRSRARYWMAGIAGMGGLAAAATVMLVVGSTMMLSQQSSPDDEDASGFVMSGPSHGNASKGKSKGKRGRGKAYYEQRRMPRPTIKIIQGTSARNRPVGRPSAQDIEPLQAMGYVHDDNDRWEDVPAEPTGRKSTDYGINPFVDVASDRYSTFAVDVDTASYTMTRRTLKDGYLPAQSSVRVEEFVNYLPYEYRQPEGSPFAVDFEAAPSPFNPGHTLVRVGVQGKRVAFDQRKPVHLTLLVDTSGSMQAEDKIGLLKTSMRTLTQELQDGDTVAIVAYAGSAGLILAPTPMSQRATIMTALDRLTAGGSTAMGAGIELAYAQAEASYESGAVNRVIICSDGDANVGRVRHQDLSALIKQHAKRGITLTTLGFGRGAYNDTIMERLANDGDGNYYFIDSEKESRRVFVDQLTSTLEVIAKDVKIQVEWHPEAVQRYRLVGYENRDVADRDFRNDAVDAGEIGAGHQVTALYEVVQKEGGRGPLATVRVRNKAPGPDAPAVERAFTLDRPTVRASFRESSSQFRMAVAAAGFAEKLRGSPHLAEVDWQVVRSIAQGAKRVEYDEDRELVELIDIASKLAGR